MHYNRQPSSSLFTSLFVVDYASAGDRYVARFRAVERMLENIKYANYIATFGKINNKERTAPAKIISYEGGKLRQVRNITKLIKAHNINVIVTCSPYTR